MVHNENKRKKASKMKRLLRNILCLLKLVFKILKVSKAIYKLFRG